MNSGGLEKRKFEQKKSRALSEPSLSDDEDHKSSRSKAKISGIYEEEKKLDDDI